MDQLVIAIDCDDVLIPTTPYFVRAYNERYGTHATLQDARTPNPEIWGASEQDILHRWHQLTENQEYRELKPSLEDVQVLRRLADSHVLHLVTARKDSEREFTQKVISQSLDGIFNAMDFVGWDGSKGDICQRIQADVLIDDNGHHLLDALGCGLPNGSAILFGDYPWNVDYRDQAGVVFCKNWLEVEREIERIAQV